MAPIYLWTLGGLALVGVAAAFDWMAHRSLKQQLNRIETHLRLVIQQGVQIMAEAADILAAQQASRDALANINTDLDALIALLQNAGPGGLSPADTQTVLQGATALRDGLVAAAAKYAPATPPTP
jgi:hypothetical protein